MDKHLLFFLFFQAEDGIREIGVTGVQTCALPISVNPVNPVAPVDPVDPVNPVNPVEGPADTAGLSDSGGGSSRFPGRPIQEIAFPTRGQLLSLVQGYRDGGFEMCIDLCRVDYLTHFNRQLPDGVPPERFEVVVNLLSLSTARRVRLRVQLPESDLEAASIFDVYPGVEAMEREAFDMFGIIFAGHPDL